MSRPSLERITLHGLCPKCGKAKIFSGILTIKLACPACGLNFNARENGDGPAFFGITIIGTLATIGAAVTEIIYSPAYWITASIWIPFIIIGSLIVLRLAKACMLGLQYGANPEDFAKDP
jgi:uncharacterized protein (DUF983 family)